MQQTIKFYNYNPNMILVNNKYKNKEKHVSEIEFYVPRINENNNLQAK